jgi:hypothetical protein
MSVPSPRDRLAPRAREVDHVARDVNERKVPSASLNRSIATTQKWQRKTFAIGVPVMRPA